MLTLVHKCICTLTQSFEVVNACYIRAIILYTISIHDLLGFMKRFSGLLCQVMRSILFLSLPWDNLLSV